MRGVVDAFALSSPRTLHSVWVACLLIILASFSSALSASAQVAVIGGSARRPRAGARKRYIPGTAVSPLLPSTTTGWPGLYSGAALT